MFGMFSVPWDFFHIGLLVIVIMIMIIGMVICVSVIGVCCFHWLASLDESRGRGNRRRNNGNGNTQVDPSCPHHQYDNSNQSVHVVVVPEKLPKGAGGITMDPCQLREHFTRMEADVSQRRFLFEERTHQDHQLGMGSLPPQPQQPPPPDDGPPPSYDMLYPTPNPTVGSTTNTVAT